MTPEFFVKLPGYVDKARAYLASDMGRANFGAMLSGKHPRCGGERWSFERAVCESVMFSTGLFASERVLAVADEIIIERLDDGGQEAA